MSVKPSNRLKNVLCNLTYRQFCTLRSRSRCTLIKSSITRHENFTVNSQFQTHIRMFNTITTFAATLSNSTDGFESRVSLCTAPLATGPASGHDGAPGIKYLEEASVYVHWPYCRQLCSYCSFVKYVPKAGTPWTLDDEVMETAMVQELQAVLRASHIRRVTSVFFGGGTPSLARPQLVQRILEGVGAVCTVVPDAEVSLEGNPSSLSPDKMAAFVAAGVNRLSIGVQTLEQSALTSLRRDHSSTEAVRCVEAARTLLPGKVSLDMLFARPGQTLDQWRKELDAALHFSDDHIALYQLTLEPGTPLYRHVHAGIVQMPCADTQADMYEHAVASLTGSRGFTRYEVANFSRSPASESRHNKNYWQAGQYIGVGPGAHSRIVPLSVDAAYWSARKEVVPADRGNGGSKVTSTNVDEKHANADYYAESACGEIQEHLVRKYPTRDLVVREERINAPDPARWLSEIEKKGNGVAKTARQRRQDVLSEYLATGLRTVEGVRRRRWQQIDTDAAFKNIFNSTSIKHFIEGGLLSLSDDCLRATARGMNVVDSIVPDLLNLLKSKSK